MTRVRHVRQAARNPRQAAVRARRRFLGAISTVLVLGVLVCANYTAAGPVRPALARFVAMPMRSDTSCTVALAKRLVALPSTPPALRAQIAMNAPYPGGGIAAVSCIDVTGRDPDLEFDVSTGGSAGFESWAVYRKLPSGWRFAAWKPGPGRIPIGFLHGDVVETVGVYRPGDPFCCASGGYDHYELHWNGRGFVRVGFWRSGMPSLTDFHWGTREVPVTISPGVVGPLKLGRSTTEEVRAFEGTPSNEWSGIGEYGTPPFEPPVDFSGTLWLYSCGPDCWTIFGFTNGTLRAFETGDPRFRAFGHVRVGSSLTLAESVGHGAFSGFDVQCPGVDYPAQEGLFLMAAISRTKKVFLLYEATTGAGFSSCGS